MTSQTVKAHQKLPVVQVSLGSFILGNISISCLVIKLKTKSAMVQLPTWGTSFILIFYFIKAIDRATLSFFRAPSPSLHFLSAPLTTVQLLIIYNMEAEKEASNPSSMSEEISGQEVSSVLWKGPFYKLFSCALSTQIWLSCKGIW